MALMICIRCGALHDDGSALHCLDCIDEIITEKLELSNEEDSEE